MARKEWDLIDVKTIDFDDKKVWDMLARGETTGVFQLEGAGITEVCVRMKPTSMNDLCMLLAVYRPDTMSAIEHIIKRRNKEEETEYIHEDAKEILQESYGQIIYQEQIMAFTRIFAGFDNIWQDKFRKGIGKKSPELIKQLSEEFKIRALKKGYKEEIVENIFQQLKSMGSYAFNKSHSMSYAITSYKTAWLKANYPTQFMCSLLANQKKSNGTIDYDSIGLYIMKCKEMGIEILYPSINTSKTRFTICGKDIQYGLLTIKGVNNNAVKEIFNKRPFNSIEDVIERTNINKTSMISLIKSGSLDFTGEDRGIMLKKYGKYRFENKLDEIKPIQNINKTHIQKLIDGGYVRGKESELKDLCLMMWNKLKANEHSENWETNEMTGNEFNWEYDSICYHLRGNPFEGIEFEKWDSIKEEERVKIGGTIIAIEKKKIKKGRNIGKTMAFLQLDTQEGVRKVTVFNDKWDLFQDLLTKGEMIVIIGTKQKDDLIFSGAKTLEQFKQTEM